MNVIPLKKCGFNQCTSGLTANWSPILLLWARGYSKKSHSPAEMRLSLMICEACKKTFVMSDIMTNESKQMIDEQFLRSGKQPADWDKAEIKWTTQALEDFSKTKQASGK